MVTTTPNGTATFSFTGVAIYFLAPLWPYERSSGLMLDAGPIVRFDLTDHSHVNVTGTPGGPATVKSEVIASVVGLGNTLHTVQVLVAEGQSSSVFDRFMYTILEPEDLPPVVTSPNPPHFSTPNLIVTSSGSTTTTASPIRTSTPSSASLSKTRRISGALNTALIVTCVVVFLFICGVAWLLVFSENGIHTCYRRRRGLSSPNELEIASGGSTPSIIEEHKGFYLSATPHSSALYPPHTMVRSIPWVSPPMYPPSPTGEDGRSRRWSMSMQLPSSPALQEVELQAKPEDRIDAHSGAIDATPRR
ncbi:uncharacterized protein LACBIDRAFT_301967 [Laccaria bicolor S238N-H82]|uniref:Predicted protein n=1 Tax=Laccaria bicolor (strain S238N-H82 / ATCC MYA-4686) TaxID=486041 RepID=B0CQ20_LACBS|nr:uncharacterized protein LACBIDRAFT_301967 [Laccaria bicolor S238N-H82]EDR15512.1 predicted protein [Laccaria bicolor S238N-H82]|eukprot:XP_001873720.1 predicted protein [Laccaria bicolor S238N-H82]